MSSGRSRSGGRAISKTLEPVVQVLAEGAAFDRLGQVAIGRGDETDLRANHPVAAEPRELALLERAQELGLDRRRHLADLVEEQHAAAGLFDAARLHGHGAGERAALVAEELGLEQLIGQGRAVDGA